MMAVSYVTGTVLVGSFILAIDTLAVVAMTPAVAVT